MKNPKAPLIEIIATGFHAAFSIKCGGQVRRFPCCDWHDDKRFVVVAEAGKFWLISEDSRDGNFAELGREELSPTTEFASGYHDDEHAQWNALRDSEKLAIAQKEAA